MITFQINSLRLALAASSLGALILMNADNAKAQTKPTHEVMHTNMPSGSNHLGAHDNHNNTNNRHSEIERQKTIPTMPGQGAFGAIAEIVSILEADDQTNWAQVDITSLRNHLASMNRLVMEASVQETRIVGGLELVITGNGQTINAIQEMVPAHTPMINGFNGWSVKSELVSKGAKLTVTSNEKNKTSHIRGLGFYGLMVSGSHHQIHHLALARGENIHAPSE